MLPIFLLLWFMTTVQQRHRGGALVSVRYHCYLEKGKSTKVLFKDLCGTRTLERRAARQ
jgi:hypothetical protein